MSGFIVVNGALIKCVLGAMPTPLTLNVSREQVAGKSVCLITDNQPGVNIKPFGICGLTQLPCSPNTPSPWTNDTAVQLGGLHLPVITQTSVLQCMIGGSIQILYPGQTTVSIGISPELMRLTNSLYYAQSDNIEWSAFVASEIQRYGGVINNWRTVRSVVIESLPVDLRIKLFALLLPNLALGGLVFPTVKEPVRIAGVELGTVHVAGESERVRLLIEAGYGEKYRMKVGNNAMDTSGLGNIIFGYYFEGPQWLEDKIADEDQSRKPKTRGQPDPPDDVSQRRLGRWLNQETGGDFSQITPEMIQEGAAAVGLK